MYFENMYFTMPLYKVFGFFFPFLFCSHLRTMVPVAGAEGYYSSLSTIQVQETLQDDSYD